MTLQKWFQAADTNNSDYILENLQTLKNSRDTQGNTALIRASFAGNVNLCNVLSIEHSNRNNQGRTALMQSIFSKAAQQLIQLLQEEIQLQDALGQTALMLASQINNFQVVKLLQKEVGMVDYKRRTALMHAASFCSVEIAVLLIDREARAQDVNGMSALMFAARKGCFELVQKLASVEGKLKNKKGETALAIAVLSGNVEIIEFLSQVEGDVSVQGMKILEFAGENQKGVEGLDKVVERGILGRQRQEELMVYQQRNQGLGEKAAQEMAGKAQEENQREMLKINKQLGAIESNLQQLRANQLNPQISSRFDILSDLIESNNLQSTNQMKKMQQFVNELKLQVSEIQTEFYDLRSSVKLVGQQNKQINNILEKQQGNYSENQVQEKQAVQIDNTDYQLVLTSFQQQQQVISQMGQEIANLQQENSQFREQISRLSQQMGSGTGDNSQLSAQMEENTKLMQMLVQNQQRDNLDAIIEQLGNLKIDQIGTKNELQFIRDNDHDSRLSNLEKQINMLQKYIFNK